MNENIPSNGRCQCGAVGAHVKTQDCGPWSAELGYSKHGTVASEKENTQRLATDLATARKLLCDLLFAVSVSDIALARIDARRFLGHPPAEGGTEMKTLDRIRQWAEHWSKAKTLGEIDVGYGRG